ncbi:MAG: hypothetical protein ABGZ35_12235 [Planctomycetaceae bacterium]
MTDAIFFSLKESETSVTAVSPHIRGKRYSARRVFFAVILLASCRTFTSNSAAGQTFEPLSGNKVGVYIHAEHVPALDDRLLNRVYDRTAGMMLAMLGTKTMLKQLSVPALDLWLSDHSLNQLTANVVHTNGLRPFEDHNLDRVIFLKLSFQKGTYRVEVTELDDYLFDVSIPLIQTTVQRETLPSVAGRLALDSWSPVGQITDRSKVGYVVEIPNLQQLKKTPRWSRLQSGAVLQIFHEYMDSNGELKSSPAVTDQFLIVDSFGTGNSLMTRLAVADPQYSSTTGYFSQLGNTKSARYLARIVPNRKEEFRIQALIRETGSPREDCVVFESEHAPSGNSQLGRRVGFTDVDGMVTVRPRSGGLRYITVQYDNVYRTRVFVPSVTADLLPFYFAHQGASLDLTGPLTLVEDQIESLERRINDVTSQINDAIKRLDIDEIQSLKKNREQLLDQVQAFQKRLDGISKTAKDRVPALVTRVDAAIKRAQNIEKKVAANQVDEGNARLKRYQLDLDVALGGYQWKQALDILEQYVPLKQQLGNLDANESGRLRHLRAALAATDVQLVAARSVVESASGIRSGDDLLKRWDTVRDALQLLVKHNDYYWTEPMLKEYRSWRQLLDVAVVVAVNDGKGKLDEVAARANAKRLKQITLTLEEFSDIETEMVRIQNDYPF